MTHTWRLTESTHVKGVAKDCLDCKYCHAAGWNHYYCSLKDLAVSRFEGENCEWLREYDENEY